MEKLSYDSPEIKQLFEKSRDKYTITDWQLLAEFHEYHHQHWINTSLSLIKEALDYRSAYDKLYSHFIKKFGLLPSRVKLKGLLNATRGRPRKTTEHKMIREFINAQKSLGMKDEDVLQELHNLNYQIDMRQYSRIKNGR